MAMVRAPQNTVFVIFLPKEDPKKKPHEENDWLNSKHQHLSVAWQVSFSRFNSNYDKFTFPCSCAVLLLDQNDV